MSEEHLDTIFVRGLLPGTNTEELNDAFAEIGPIKSAFIVVEKDGPNKGKSKGFGFVQFAIADDAQTAVTKMQNVVIGDSKVTVDLAQKKGFKHQKSQSDKKSTQNSKAYKKTKPEVAESIFQKLAKEAIIVDKKAKDGNSSSDTQLQKTEEMLRDCSVIFFNVPKDITSKKFEQYASKAGKINIVEMPLVSVDLGKSHESVAMVIYTKCASASNAVTKLSNKRINKQSPTPVFCRRFKQIATSKPSQARCRLVVRNLPFSVDQNSLQELFSKYGPIVDVNIPHGEKKGSHKGFGFVQFACRFDAARAVSEMNAKTVGDRPIAVDWALSKEDYAKATQGVKNVSKKDVISKVEDSARDDHDDDDDDDESVDDENEDEDDDIENEDEEEEDEEVDDDEEEEEEENDDDDDDEASENDSDDYSNDISGNENAKEPKRQTAPDASELSTTLFVRNILFETTETELFLAFKKFGGVRYVKIAKHADGRSKGVAFVCFYKRPAYERALKEALLVPATMKHTDSKSPAGEAVGAGISVAGRPLLVCGAVEKDTAKKLNDPNKPKIKTDKRHIYLMREGVVRADEVDIPQTDVKKRERAENEKKTKLKNPMFFVSPVRLAVRNLFRGDDLDKAVTEKDLKQIFLKAAKDGLMQGVVEANEGDISLFPPGWPKKQPRSIAIKQAKILHEEIPATDAKKPKLGRSKGFGFVEFAEHVHALAALRMLNNNPAYSYLAIGGPRSMKVKAAQRSRLIVEFAVENKAKLRARDMKLGNQKLPKPVAKNADTNEEEAKRKKSKKRPAEMKLPTDMPRPPKRNKVKKSRQADDEDVDMPVVNHEKSSQSVRSVPDVKNLISQYKSSILNATNETERKRWFDVE